MVWALLTGWDLGQIIHWKKDQAGRILSELEDDKIATGHDAFTNGLINYYKQISPTS